jgi:hypothetical protein
MTDCADPNCYNDSSCDEGLNCSDGVDNDLDGWTDCADSDCSPEPFCDESLNCSDAIDNDLDGWTDCADPDCGIEPSCDESLNCSDDIDNDLDELTDCADPDCGSYPPCDESLNCSDSIDNDLDGDTDCDDSDCYVCDPPTAVCQSITRQVACGGTLTVYANEIAGDSTAGGVCCNISIGIRRPTFPYTETVSFTEADIATSPNTVYAKVTQSDGKFVYCTGYVTVETAAANPVLIGAVSRKTHANAGDWDIDVGSGDVESRSAQLGTASANELKIIAEFDIAVAVLGGTDAVQTDLGTVTGVTANADGNPNKVEIDFTDAPTAGQINLTFGDGANGVVDATCATDPTTASASALCVSVVVGDDGNDGTTGYADFNNVRTAGYLNQTVSSDARARADFDCSGEPDFLDFSKIQNAGLLNQTAATCSPPITP